MKLFPLYNDIADLCDSVIATGAGAFRGMCGLEYGSSEQAEESEVDPGAGNTWFLKRNGWMRMPRCILFLLMSGAGD